MILLQLSAAQGPAECCLAVSLASRQLIQEATVNGIDISLVEDEAGSEIDTFKSMLFRLEGESALTIAHHWNGSMQWICQSPFRPQHKRKNWFFSGSFSQLDINHSSFNVADKELSFDACYSSGLGGQHANKTSSAIRATHIATGISVKVESERSQHANKRLARVLIEHKLRLQYESEQQGADLSLSIKSIT